MSKIYSFDVFDTLITRKVALPHHIFLLTGLRIRRELETGLEPQIFANARVQAEKEFSNSDDHSGGITKIYEYLAAALNVPDELKAQMLQIELETEAENIIPIEKNVELLEKLREESDQVIYISDMYLGENFITKILGDLGIHREGERVFVSCDYGAEKTSGKLFDIVTNELGIQNKDLHHFGNSKKSDIRGADKAGVASTYLGEGNLNRHEKYLALSNDRHPLSTENIIRYSKFAAASRHARLKRGEENKQIFDVSCSIAAPVIYSFVSDVLEKAKDKRIYFLARDGYIMHKIASRIIEKKKLNIDVRYLYLSREVLILAKYDEMEYDQYINYLIEVLAEERLKIVFDKLKVSEGAVTALGLTPSELNQKLDEFDSAKIHEIFSDKALHEDIGRECVLRKKRLLEYFKAEGLLDKKEIAIVDTGWKLTIQNQMASLFNEHQVPQPEGYYFGINESAYSSLNNGRKYGFYWDLRKEESSLDDHKIVRIFEVFCSAPHGQTVDYVMNGNSIEPKFKSLDSHVIEWGYKDMEKGIMMSVDSLLDLFNKDEIRSDWWDRLILRGHLESFWYRPKPEEINLWGRYPYNISSDGRKVVELFKKKSFIKLFFYGLRRGKLPNTRLDHWPHAYTSVLHPVQGAIVNNTIRIKRFISMLRRGL